tara:strand:- start:579 stop:779 length:201 start_codon:yes stop_codon:yes gene_type:complete
MKGKIIVSNIDRNGVNKKVRIDDEIYALNGELVSKLGIKNHVELAEKIQTLNTPIVIMFRAPRNPE